MKTHLKLLAFTIMMLLLSGQARNNAQTNPEAAPLTVGFTSANADILMDSFNANYYTSDGFGRGHYSVRYVSLSKQPPGFWRQAELIEAAEDAAVRNSRYLPLVRSLLNGFLSMHGNNWTGDTKFNDDLMWGVITFVRGYRLTRDASYLKSAKLNFDEAWKRGLDKTAGGMWWNTDNNDKPAAVEGPCTVAAYLLGESLHEDSYKQKSKTILDYMVAHYYDSGTGAIYSKPIGSEKNPKTSHNQGLFVIAADLNGEDQYARSTAEFLMTMGHVTPDSNGYKILPDYGIQKVTSENNAVALRWMVAYMKSHHLESKYLGWLQANASAAWTVRDPSRNLSWDNWYNATPNGESLMAWDCIASLVALQVVPPPTEDQSLHQSTARDR